MEETKVLLSQILAAQIITARYAAFSFHIQANGGKITPDDVQEIAKEVDTEVAKISRAIRGVKS